jgi:hypothetical protein
MYRSEWNWRGNGSGYYWELTASLLRIGDDVARPEKSIIARTSNTELQVATTTVVLDIVA